VPGGGEGKGRKGAPIHRERFWGEEEKKKASFEPETDKRPRKNGPCSEKKALPLREERTTTSKSVSAKKVQRGKETEKEKKKKGAGEQPGKKIIERYWISACYQKKKKSRRGKKKENTSEVKVDDAFARGRHSALIQLARREASMRIVVMQLAEGRVSCS